MFVVVVVVVVGSSYSFVVVVVDVCCLFLCVPLYLFLGFPFCFSFASLFVFVYQRKPQCILVSPSQTLKKICNLSHNLMLKNRIQTTHIKDGLHLKTHLSDVPLKSTVLYLILQRGILCDLKLTVNEEAAI